MLEINGIQFKKMIEAGSAYLNLYREQVDELNVFPVPDGDTGTNMNMTFSSAVREATSLMSDELSDVAKAFSKGALRGARGNSGVITSQIMKGFDVVCSDKNVLTSKDFAEAMKQGTEIAYSAVTKPKEGTILTVIRVMAETAISITKRKQIEIEDFFVEILKSGEEILNKTPDMLPVLKKAGVVDAGGKGLLCIFNGFFAALTGQEIPKTVEPTTLPKLDDSSSLDKDFYDNDYENITYAYCTEYFIVNLFAKTTEADILKHKETLLEIGDCVLVIGDLTLVKVHVHTNNPDQALKSALQLGEIANIKIENMLEQNRAIKSKAEEKIKKEKKDYAMISVCAGKGLADIFRELQVDYVVEGGQTMNPSVYDILNAINKVNAKTVFILPNNGNIILAAEQAKELADCDVRVLPTKHVPEGVAAAMVFDSFASVEENFETMLTAGQSVKTAEITHAVRKTKLNGFDVRIGDIIGISNKEIVACGETVPNVLISTLEDIVDANIEMVTLYYGEDLSEDEVQNYVAEVEKRFPDLEIAFYYGGQPHYYFLLSVE